MSFFCFFLVFSQLRSNDFGCSVFLNGSPARFVGIVYNVFRIIFRKRRIPRIKLNIYIYILYLIYINIDVVPSPRWNRFVKIEQKKKKKNRTYALLCEKKLSFPFEVWDDATEAKTKFFSPRAIHQKSKQNP